MAMTYYLILLVSALIAMVVPFPLTVCVLWFIPKKEQSLYFCAFVFFLLAFAVFMASISILSYYNGHETIGAWVGWIGGGVTLLFSLGIIEFALVSAVSKVKQIFSRDKKKKQNTVNPHSID